MVKVVQSGQFSVYIYMEIGEPHHRPHCHVQWTDGRSVVALPDLTLLAGPRLPKNARQLLDEHLAELRDAWNGLNPGREIQ